MKTLQTKLNTGLFLIAILGLLASSFVAFPAKNAEAAVLSTTCNSATLQGRFETDGMPTEAWFDWGPGSSVSNSTPHQSFNSGTATFQATLTGLSENSTYSYRSRAANEYGSPSAPIETFTTKSCTQDVNPTVTLTADSTNISYNSSTTVRWNSSNATSCSASNGTNGWSGSKGLSGSFGTGALTGNTTYNITCSNGTGSANASVTVTVNGNNNNNNRPTVSIYANPSSVAYGGSSTINWNSSNADSCNATGGTNGWYGYKNLSGSFYTGNLNGNTSFSINCTNNNGSAYDSVTVYVNGNNIYPIYNNPTVNIYADQTSVAYNGVTTIRWNTTNASYCNASGGSIGWSGTKSIGPGSFYTGSLTDSKTYTITCTNNTGSATDSVTVNVRGQVINNTVITTRTTTPKPQTSLVLVTSTVDRNRPIVPTLDNTNPCPGDDINYSMTYQNIGTASISNVVLRVDLPADVDFLSATPVNPNISGQTLIFNLGSLGANKSGTVGIRVHVRDTVVAGAPLNFPAVLSYTDPSGNPNSVNANVSANVCGTTVNQNGNNNVSLGALVFGAGFLPTSIVGWLLLIILILVLILLAKYLFGQSFQRRTVTTLEQPSGKKTTTTTTL